MRTAPPDCRRCPALAANRHRVVNGYGEVPAQVMFVGEAPGRLGADVTGVPFTRDRSGRRLQALLIHLGLSLETDPASERPRLQRCYLTNAVRCNPPNNRRPNAREIAACQPYLIQEIAAVRPLILVPVGLLATGLILRHLGLPRGPMKALHARPLVPPDRIGSPRTRWVLPLRHPSRASNAELEQFAEVLSALLTT